MNFAQLIDVALISGTGDEKTTVENQLIKIRTENPTNFFKNCMTEFTNDSNNIAIRQAAGTILAATVIIQVIYNLKCHYMILNI